MRASSVGLAILYWFRHSTGSTAPSRAGLRNLLQCQLVASGAGLGLAVADDAEHQQVGMIKRRAEGVQQRVAQLAALVEGAGRLRRAVAGHAAGEGELAEQRRMPVVIRRHRAVYLGVGALQPGARVRPRPAVAGAGDEDRVQVARLDQPVGMGVHQVQAGHRAEVAEQPRLDVLGAQRLAQQRVVHQVDLADGQVIGRPPPRVDQPQFRAAERPGRVGQHVRPGRDGLPAGAGRPRCPPTCRRPGSPPGSRLPPGAQLRSRAVPDHAGGMRPSHR